MVRLNPGDVVLRMNGEDFGGSTGWKADVVAADMFDVWCPDVGRPKPTHNAWYSDCIGHWEGKLSFALFEAYKMLSEGDRNKLFVEFETFVVNIELLQVLKADDEPLDKSFLVGDFAWGTFVDATVYVKGRDARIAVDKVGQDTRWVQCAEMQLKHIALAKVMDEFFEPTW